MQVFNRIATSILEMIGKVLWGFKPNLMKDIVAQEGSVNSLSWFARNMPTYEKTLDDWGAIRTHLLATEISVLNGCSYCTYGHASALQLHYYKDYGKLLPSDEDQIASWHSVSEDETVDRFRELIGSAELSSELPILERMLVLRRGSEEPTSEEDRKIVHFIKMFQLLNRCGINAKTSHDQAHDPINKDSALREQYQQVRGEIPDSPPHHH
ncbi:MAG: hypothetical protein H0T73_18215 [Ardenticatenales bacterium]|nr:hypothetical protein [Ardenticatenales bacterium]